MASNTVSLARILLLVLFPIYLCACVATLVQEGALRRACAALLRDPPVHPTDEVVSALRLLHFGSSIEDRVNMNSLRRVAARAGTDG